MTAFLVLILILALFATAVIKVTARREQAIDRRDDWAADNDYGPVALWGTVDEERWSA